ncbi:hypothetical protein Hanom_Chr06g00542141 [Helianthus anomalus]
MTIIAPSCFIITILAVNSNMSSHTTGVAHSVIIPITSIIIPITTFTPNAQIIALFGLVIFLPYVCWFWLLSTVVRPAPLITNIL